MPKLSAWLVRAALAHFAAWGAIGGLLLASKAVALPGWLWLLRPAHVDGLLVGFVVQLAFGVALWILPKAPLRSGAPPAAMAGVLLNAGVGLVALGGVLPGLAALAGAGRIAEAAAVAAFAVHVWPRVRAARGAGRA
jgi:hypothetical protein